MYNIYSLMNSLCEGRKNMAKLSDSWNFWGIPSTGVFRTKRPNKQLHFDHVWSVLGVKVISKYVYGFKTRCSVGPIHWVQTRTRITKWLAASSSVGRTRGLGKQPKPGVARVEADRCGFHVYGPPTELVIEETSWFVAGSLVAEMCRCEQHQILYP